MGGGWVDVWMDVLVGVWWLGRCLIGCIVRWVVLGLICR